MSVFQNKELEALVKQEYKKQDIDTIWTLLNEKKSFNFPTVQGRGLFKAALEEADTGYTGYSNVWVRDNIHVAHAHFVMGKYESAAKTVEDIVAFWAKYKHRWIDCILGRVDVDNVMNRPHIRFNGTELKENEQKWSHAQNDAIGYLVWLYSKLALLGHLVPNSEMLVLISMYHLKIQFWNDLDNGHWEESRKVEASSVGCATAGYRELLLLLQKKPQVMVEFKKNFVQITKDFSLDQTLFKNYFISDPNDLLLFLYHVGLQKLNEILPFESRTPGQERQVDGALLFLAYPLQIIQGELADTVVGQVVEKLSGDFGIKRYLGDSYWMADYKNLFTEENRTADFSDDMTHRDNLLKKDQEAQWCIFDSIASCYYGLRFKELKEKGMEYEAKKLGYRELQTKYLNRALGQVTGDDCRFGPWLCPESYYIEDSRNGKYVVNDVCPLLWTQANLINALHIMKETSL
jgi:hypothetical protein